MVWVFSLSGLFILCLLIRERELRKKAEHLLTHATQENQRLEGVEVRLKQIELESIQLNLKKELAEEKVKMLQEAQEGLKDVFSSISSEALEKNNHQFLHLAKSVLERFQEGAKGDLDKRQDAIRELLHPVKESLQKLDQGMRQIEKERQGDQASLKEQVRSLLETERQLKIETSNLVKALRTPLARGRWGEIQLKRVVELAGMLNHCDFFEQKQEEDREERYRPDLIVRLPGGRQVVVDAKVPLEAYLEAVQAEDENVRLSKFKIHAKQVRSHVAALGKKGYWERFQPSPEFVVLFLPAETFFSTALEYDPSLIEVGAKQKVILATPTTLIALLRAVAYGWQQESLTRQVESLHALGQDLYKRLIDMGSHFSKMGRGLSSAVDAYNKGIGSLESRVLVTARKFHELGVVSESAEIQLIDAVEKIPRDFPTEPFSSGRPDESSSVFQEITKVDKP